MVNNMFLAHIGIKRRSGRYPWGSGDDPYQHEDFLRYVNTLRKKGYSEKEIAKNLNMNTSDLRSRISISKSAYLAEKRSQVLILKDKGYSNTAIADKMGTTEANVRYWLKPALNERLKIVETTSNLLKDSINQYKYIDIGSGVENHLGISKTKLNNAVKALENEGYKVQYLKVPQLGNPNQFTSLKVLTKDDVTYSELLKNQKDIHVINSHSEDGGRTFTHIEPPRSIKSSKVKIVYAEDGGADKDGVIELRKGIPELSLGQSRYAQVRIGVDGSHYMKGMAIYNDNMPKGIDVLYNTNKKRGTPQEKVFKKMDDDPTNPFGTTIRQKYYLDPKTGEKKLSMINIVGSREGLGEEGGWNTWSKTISSQVLSKQPVSLAKQQLAISRKTRENQLEDIRKVTNPNVRKKLLLAYADECDAASVHLKAAALPRQRNAVLLPLNSLKENEVYAPNYKNGEKIALIRHPHGGRFEIPELVVNNKNKEGRSLLGNVTDAIGINSKKAQQLSGADFDGDSVLTIPNNKGEIKTSKQLKDLANFDPKERYPAYPNMKRINKKTQQIEMGSVSNLITDMTLKGASNAEIANAVKHSMVVIDAEKHYLNYKQSEKDHNIAYLKEKYQGGKNKGASTLISRASSEYRISEVKNSYKINPKTGEKIYEETGRTYIDKHGQTKLSTTKTTKMAAVKNAHSLSSGEEMEKVYGDYANALKSLANTARKESLSTPHMEYSPSAKKIYKNEVASLDSKLNIAEKNAPLERKARTITNMRVKEKIKSNPELKDDPDKMKKIEAQILSESRQQLGAKKHLIEITPKEWEAIQSGAISSTKLDKILNNADLDKVKVLATPKQAQNTVSYSKKIRVKTMLNKGYTYAEISEALGISTNSIANIEKE